jgi:4-azaleucine resistance transporter AzlC
MTAVQVAEGPEAAELDSAPADRVTISRSGIAAGVRRSLPLAASVFAYGMVFGMLARQAGLALHETALMSALVYAGTAQFLALELWRPSVPVLALVITTLVVNLRHLLMGAAIRRWLTQLPRWQLYGLAFFISDESWALAMDEYGRGRRDAGFFLGSGLALFAAWLPAGVVGYLAGSAVRDPARWGLDVAFTAAFVALLVGMWRGRHDALPWIAAVSSAVMAERWLPGSWYILIGGLAGSIVGGLRDAR